MNNPHTIIQKEEFKSSQNVRWCPGCGDHAILNSVQKAMAELNLKREEVVVVSGIGCSSRFTYYMNTFGFHTIHGRGSAIASGVKIANPDLKVWQITGDGDALAIGGNHFIHTIRRNIDLNIILFNNQIYGLTKGQFSPTSRRGFISKTSPFGTIEHPFRPGELAIGARGNFFARSMDRKPNLCTEIFKEAAQHKGTSIVEVLQNCVIYNDKTHEELTHKEEKHDRTIILKHGEPMIFGKNRDKGLILDGMQLKVVKIGENGLTESDLLVHDAECQDSTLHLKLANMEYPEFPVALGVIRKVKAPVYDQEVINQIERLQSTSTIKTFRDLAIEGDVWEVE
ncbi:2-oxoacid:ferredoxin oxidoreductase subunit beta [Alkalitalea saponilacus]|uniref:2-oxoglutarate ferredoxin oxidoreductase subunit beta n=1 Tax=Alkalitalea saponilacus TaxID=889453 RepID=A0A1T5HTM7_9BACT|nr:2-oxoacid:ferredoxin oxidoreductase subunit beta [Alkalitalea saponilacus]ASB48526.1 2-oxoacid:ferredoxin oxidoreductase subunit beta [Alkalitalea saponilacus]SKC23850.1 2-oxoglutarate ferredoxin oxidoreductase subunit beta [Alkalitalea saponilacus]